MLRIKNDQLIMAAAYGLTENSYANLKFQPPIR